MRNTEAYTTASLQVTYYPGKSSSSFTLYDDDGTTNLAWKKGSFELLYFEAGVEENRYRIRISSNGGTFEKKPRERSISLIVPALNRRPAAVKINGQPVPVATGTGIEATEIYACWNPATASLQIGCVFSGVLQNIEIVK